MAFRTTLKKKMKIKFVDADSGTTTTEHVKIPFMPALNEQAAINEEQPYLGDDLPVSAPETMDDEPSKYYKRRTNNWELWCGLLPEFLHIYREVQAPPSLPICSSCNGSNLSEVFRCRDCQPCPEVLMCADCLTTGHSQNKLHKPEIWEGGVYRPYNLDMNFDLPSHKDCIKFSKGVTVLDKKGRQHSCTFHLCACMPEVLQYFRMGFWPASPSSPCLLAEVDMCHLWDVLTLETNISVSSFFDTMNILSDNTVDCVKGYRPFKEGDSLHTYRVFSSIKDNVVERPICFACPKDNDNIIFAMDGNFGLVHKDNASKCKNPALSRRFVDKPLFLEQEEVDDFVNSQQTVTKKMKGIDCSRFQAGDETKAKNRTANLNFTGVFAISCRHEIVHKMLNMRHGERLSYPVFILKKLQESLSLLNLTPLVLYDIACVLKPHVKKYYPDLADIDMAIPIFHCYGHQGSCQLTMNPRRKESYGMSDGEWTERIWSFLRPFSVITKEQTQGHREDCLTIATRHLGNKKNSVLEFTLYEKLQRADVLEREIWENLNRTLKPGETLDDVKKWKYIELTNVEEQNEKKKQKAGWQEEYLKQLNSLMDISEMLVGEEDASSIVSLHKSKESLEKKLKDIERKQGIERWEKGSTEYEDACSKEEIKRQEIYLKKLQHLVVENQILKEAHRKHAVGMKTHDRISKALAKNNKNMEKLISAYNKEEFHSTDPYPHTLSTEDAYRLSDIHSTLLNNPILTQSRRECVRHLEMWQSIKEEKNIVQKEVQNLVQNLMCCYYDLEKLRTDNPQNQYNRGINALIQQQQDKLATRVATMVHLFPNVSNVSVDRLTSKAESTHLTETDIIELADD